MTHEAVLFDLDGTLVDTAPDIVDATNVVLNLYKKPAVSLDEIRPYISLGSIHILAKAMNCKKDDNRLLHWRQQLLNAYVPILAKKSRLFPGMSSLLEKLKKKNKPWGIVTNKPEWIARELITRLHFDQECQCIVGPEVMNKRKPDPDGLLYACRLLRFPPNKVTYVGDCEHDIMAAKRAGMPNIAVTWGYHLPDTNPDDWQADKICHSVEALAALL